MVKERTFNFTRNMLKRKEDANSQCFREYKE